MYAKTDKTTLLAHALGASQRSTLFVSKIQNPESRATFNMGKQEQTEILTDHELGLVPTQQEGEVVDAVFGAATENGPNFRNVSVCYRSIVNVEAKECLLGRVERHCDLDDEDTDRPWCALHSPGVRHPRPDPRPHVSACRCWDHDLVQLRYRSLQDEPPGGV